MLKLYEKFWQKLKNINIQKSDLQHLIDKTTDKLMDPIQGDYPRWLNAFQSLPAITDIKRNTSANAITCTSEMTEIKGDIKHSYEGLIPWRKGPFNMFDTTIDSEWQSFMKWNRIEQHLPELKDKTILDVGCGNGYYMFKMLQQSPFLVMGIDPGLLQTIQFWSIDKYINSGMAVLPLSIQDMPKSLNCFDVVFSMGVLYHRKSPIHHIKELANCLNSNGQLVIETLIIDGDENSCLIPTGRYAQMRNVWFLPSIKMLEIMLARCGFKNISCIDVTVTNTEEQRTTEWMKFHSLKEFLNDDLSQTIEGYPLPKRATLIAQKK
jgi:tRNA (mo5U34)-methyltransferase